MGGERFSPPQTVEKRPVRFVGQTGRKIMKHQKQEIEDGRHAPSVPFSYRLDVHGSIFNSHPVGDFGQTSIVGNNAWRVSL